MDSTLNLNQKETISAVPKDVAGNNALLDGPVTYTSADPATVAIAQTTDGYTLTNWIVPKKVGTVAIAVTATQGGVPTTETVNVTVVPDPIVSMGIVLGIPVLQ